MAEETGPGDLSYDDFERLEHLDAGGNADVHRARTPDGRVVALKTPRVSELETVDATFFGQFVEEAEIWSRLDDHDHIVSVVDWGTEPVAWIALEYMPDGDLGDHRDRLSTAERVALFADVCDAVHHAHRHGITHADLKPANLLMAAVQGTLTIKVADWGLARVLLEHSRTRDGLTVAYAAPEQIDPDAHGSVDDRTDTFQLGVIAYELFTGQHPFPADGVAARMNRILNASPTAPSQVDPSLPAALDDAVLTALAKEKADRFDAVPMFRDAVERAFDERSSEPADRRSDRVSQPADAAVQTSADPGGAEVHGQAEVETASGRQKHQPGDDGGSVGDDTAEPSASHESGDTAADESDSADPEPEGADADSTSLRDRLYGWWHRAPDDVADDTAFRYAHGFPRTTSRKSFFRGYWVAAGAIFYLLTGPAMYGYMMDVARAAARGDQSAPEIGSITRQYIRGLGGLGVLFVPSLASLLFVAPFSGGTGDPPGPVALVAVLLWSINWYGAPALFGSYAVTRNLRRTLRSLPAVLLSGRYLVLVVTLHVVFLLWYSLFAFSLVTFVLGPIAALYGLLVLAAYVGRHYHRRDLELVAG